MRILIFALLLITLAACQNNQTVSEAFNPGEMPEFLQAPASSITAEVQAAVKAIEPKVDALVILDVSHTSLLVQHGILEAIKAVKAENPLFAMETPIEEGSFDAERMRRIQNEAADRFESWAEILDRNLWVEIRGDQAESAFNRGKLVYMDSEKWVNIPTPERLRLTAKGWGENILDAAEPGDFIVMVGGAAHFRYEATDASTALKDAGYEMGVLLIDYPAGYTGNVLSMTEGSNALVLIPDEIALNHLNWWRSEIASIGNRAQLLSDADGMLSKFITNFELSNQDEEVVQQIRQQMQTDATFALQNLKMFAAQTTVPSKLPYLAKDNNLIQVAILALDEALSF